MTSAPVTVGIPTWARGQLILKTLDRIYACDPSPSEVIVHVDGGEQGLVRQIQSAYPAVKILNSAKRLGPGGGRDKCIRASTQPYFASFDDDSYPFDSDYFATVIRLFETHPDAAVCGAQIWHRSEKELLRNETLRPIPTFTGCGYALRLSAYREIRGYLPREVPYAIEEPDVSIQLFAKGWKVLDVGHLRVFHDTILSHHNEREITAGTIANVGLFAFLHYPVLAWPWGILQVGNAVRYAIAADRFKGITAGLSVIPKTCFQYRHARNPLPLSTLIRYLRFRRSQK